jgi:hypothetical protein
VARHERAGRPARPTSSRLRRDGIPQFLGYGVMALAVAASRSGAGRRGRALAGGVAGWLLSLGPTLSLADGRQFMLPYRWLMDVVPGFSAMRIPQRFGALATVAATALAGLGLAALRAWLAERGRPRVAAALTLAAVGLALAEARTPGLRTTPVPVGPSMPAAYRWLAEHGEGGALIEVPASEGAPLLQSIAMYNSTAHWLHREWLLPTCPPRSSCSCRPRRACRSAGARSAPVARRPLGARVLAAVGV